jgi:hypothetical protein
MSIEIESNNRQQSIIGSLAAGDNADEDVAMCLGDDISGSSASEFQLSTFERVFSTHTPIFESLLQQIPTHTIFQLYHTSSYLRRFLASYPTAWKYLSFRLLFPSGSQSRPLLAGSFDPSAPRQSRPYALDQLLMMVVMPISPCLKSLELDNTAVSGQTLTTVVLHTMRQTLEHLSVRGCKNVSLKYHIIPYLTIYGLMKENTTGISATREKLALKSLYTYRCRHHRRRPYLTTSLMRRDSDSGPTHDLVIVCHKLGIWTDTAWCSTPAGRCFRRRGYVSMRVPHGAPEVWVVFDRLWRSKNWLGSPSERYITDGRKDGRLWERGETGFHGEPLGTGDRPGGGEGKFVPAHLRHSHRSFIDGIKCDKCADIIGERCEQCSVLMHCIGCRKTLCASCAYSWRYSPNTTASIPTTSPSQSLWWTPNSVTTPCVMHDPNPDADNSHPPNPTIPPQYPNLEFSWCCTEPIFSGGGGISIGTTTRDVDLVRAAPLPKGQGWEDPEFSNNTTDLDNVLETGHIEFLRHFFGPPTRLASTCPRNLCKDCYNSTRWKVNCKSCLKPLCKEHDLRGLRLRICGYRDLALEKITLQSHQASTVGKAGLSVGISNNGLSSTRPRSSPATPFQSQVQSQGITPNMDRDSPSASSSIAGDHIAPGVGGMHPEVLQDFIRAQRQAEDSSVSGQTAGRSQSPTTSNLSRSSSRSSVYYDAAAEISRWQGCRSFYCPQYRPIGDQRQRCNSVLRECTSCSIYVCQDCVEKNTPCTCSHCEINYLCPNCLKLREADGTCRRVEEEKAKKEEKWKRDMEMLEDILDKKLANDVAEYAGEFMGLVHDGRSRNMQPSLTPLPLLTQSHGYGLTAALGPPPFHLQPFINNQDGLSFDHTTNSDDDAMHDETITPIAD